MNSQCRTLCRCSVSRTPHANRLPGESADEVLPKRTAVGLTYLRKNDLPEVENIRVVVAADRPCSMRSPVMKEAHVLQCE